MSVPWAAINNLYPAIAIYAGGGRQEAKTAVRGGGTGRGRNVVTSICTSTGNSDILQVPRTPDKCDRQWLDRSHCKTTEGAEELVSPVQDFCEGGIGPRNVQPFLPGSGTDSIVIWQSDVGDDITDWTAPGDIPPQGGEKSGGDENSDMDKHDIGLIPTRRFPAVRRLGDDGDLHP